MTKRICSQALHKWNIITDQTFFLGGVDKGRILAALRPHIFFDDQIHPHLDVAKDYTLSVHILIHPYDT